MDQCAHAYAIGHRYFEGCREFVRLHTEEMVFDPVNVVRVRAYASSHVLYSEKQHSFPALLFPSHYP